MYSDIHHHFAGDDLQKEESAPAPPPAWMLSNEDGLADWFFNFCAFPPSPPPPSPLPPSPPGCFQIKMVLPTGFVF